MGESARFDGEIDLPGGSFSRLLLSSDDAEQQNFLMYSSSSASPPPPLFSANTPKMLCFGDFSHQTIQLPNTTKPNFISHPNSHKRRNGSGQEPGKRSDKNGGAATGNQNQTEKNGKKKKNKQEVGPTRTPSAVHAKRRREKLGERIAALQQLVSPYGKTDTASVLHEAMGYIRFLQDQVKVLSSPYLERLASSSSPPHQLSEEEEGGGKWTEATKGLKSRGLCLVPVQCLIEVGSGGSTSTGDLWSSTPSTIQSSVLKP